MWPVIAGVVVARRRSGDGFRFWTTGLCFALCAFVAGTIVQEFWRGANVRRGATGSDFFTALVGLVGRNKRRYGGYIVHVGVVLFFLGCAGQTLQAGGEAAPQAGRADHARTLHGPPRRAERERRRPEADGHRVDDGLRERQGSRHGLSGEVVLPQARKRAADDGSRDSPDAGRGPLHRPRRISMSATQTASVQVVINPLVNWIWFGFGMLALGTGITLLPERTYSFALAKLPADGGDDDGRAAAGAGARGHDACRPSTSRAISSAPIVPRNDVEKASRPAAGVPVRRVRQGAGRRLRLRLRRRHQATRSPRLSTKARPRIRSCSTSSRSTAARSCSARRSTRASTAWPGCFPIWQAPAASSPSASPPCDGRGAGAPSPEAPPARRQRTGRTPRR